MVQSAIVDLEKCMATVHVRAANQIDALQHLDELVVAVNQLGFQAQPYFDNDEYGAQVEDVD